MGVRQVVTDHYGGQDVLARVLAALEQARLDPSRLSIGDLGALDHLHAGFVDATRMVLDRLDLRDGSRLLDVGSGLGGASRMAANKFGARVTGVDLTPEFVRAATELTGRMDLGGQVTFVLTEDGHLPVTDGSQDAAVMIHVGMNVPDKASLFADVRRVLVQGGRFAVYDQMRVGPGDLTYPLPWADDDRSSFVEGPEEYAEHLRGAGFTVLSTTNLTAGVAGPPPAAVGDLNPGVVMGPDFRSALANNQAATDAGALGAVLIVAAADVGRDIPQG